ncbi:MAG TPA: amidohydrolase [Candidatus Saccharimonadales bacterium]|nr:amidohydrolase [Candidatus Saccharimonadales bacterium]
MNADARHLTPADVEEMVGTRRDIHRHPELAFEEHRTAALVAQRLQELGVPHRAGVGRTGVIGTLGAAPARKPGGKVVLLRADMDALPIQEENDVPYRSTADGRMHACGHDCHVASLLAAARVLKRAEGSLRGTVKLCFQPAEEGFSGADEMIRDGVLEDPRPDAAFGYHVWQDLDYGTVAVTPGPFMAAVDEFSVTLRGKGAHAAAPHLGTDPVLAAAHVTTALQSIVSRNVDPFLGAVVSVTQVRAGNAFNIIPETAWMNGTVRVMDTAVWQDLPARFERVVQHAAAALGCEAAIEYRRTHQPTVNDPAMAALAREVAAEVVGAKRVRDDVRTMGGEDFSSFLQRVPGCFIAVGTRNAERGLVHGHHHPRFDVDERGLEIGAEILVRLALRLAG